MRVFLPDAQVYTQISKNSGFRVHEVITTVMCGRIFLEALVYLLNTLLNNPVT